MCSEDRSWWAHRLEKEIKDTSDRERQQMPSMRTQK